MKGEVEENFLTEFENGKGLFEKGKYKDAIEHLKAALLYKPKHKETLKFLGISYLKIGNIHLAISIFEEAIEKFSDDIEFFLYLAKAYKESDNHTKEIEIYRRFSEINPEFKESLLFEGLSYYREEEYGKIEEIVSKVIHPKPSNDEDINLLEELKIHIANTQIKLLEQNFLKKIVYWRPIFFPILKTYYFFTESITPECYRDDVRDMLLDIRSLNEIISIIDTCGYTPLFIMCTNQDEYYTIRNQIFENIDCDVHTEHSSHSVKIEKRFGISMEDDIQKYINFFKDKSGFLDFLELINEIEISSENDINNDINLFKYYKKADNIKNLKKCLIELSKIKENIDKKYHILKENKFRDNENLKWWFKLLNKYEQSLKFSDFILFVPISIPKILSYVMIRFTPKSKDKQLSVIKSEFKDDSIIDVFKIQAAAPEYLLIMQADSLFEFFEMVNSIFDEKGIVVIETKCVLRLWKYENYITSLKPKPFYTFDFKNLSKDNVKEELRPEIICGLLWKDSEIIDLMYRYTLGDNIEISRCERDLSFKIEYNNEDFQKIIKSNSLFDEYIYKISVKLEMRDWLKVLIILKSIPGKKQEVEKHILENILKIKSDYFARKYYTVRGLFDFIIYTDWCNLNSLRKIRKKFTPYLKGNLLIDYRSYMEERFKSTDQNPQKIERYDKNLLKGIIANSLDLASEKEENNQDKIDSVRKRCLLLIDNRLTNVTEIPKFTEYAIEMHIEKFVHAFIRFKVRNYKDFLDVWSKFEEKLFLIRKFEPLSDPLNFFCIVITTNLRTLFWFIKKLDCFCSFISLSLIHKQGFYKKILPKDSWIGLRCKPCIKSLEALNCDGCYWYPKKNQKPEPNLLVERNLRECKINFRYPSKFFEEFNIAIIKLGLNINECIANGDLDNIKIKKYHEDLVLDRFQEALNNKANIIILPELSTPKEEIINKITSIIKKGNQRNEKGEYIINQNLLVVAGSLYVKQGNNYYNQAPIITNFYNHPLSNDKSIKRFDAIKCCLSSKEKEHNELYNNRKISIGTGYLILNNTPFGDIGVIICRDFLEGDIIDKLKDKIDILLIPSATKSGEFPNKLPTIAGENYIFIAYANNEYFESKQDNGKKTTGFYGPVRKNKEIQPIVEDRDERIPPHEDKNQILYQIFDIKELDYYRANRGGNSKDGFWYYPDCSKDKRHNIKYHDKLNCEFKKARNNMIKLFLILNKEKAEENSKKFNQFL